MMNYQFEHYKQLSTEHLNKAEKHRLVELAKHDDTPLRRGVLGKRQNARK